MALIAQAPPAASAASSGFLILAAPLGAEPGAPLETTIDAGPTEGATIYERAAEFEFSTADPVVDHFECSLDLAEFAACASPALHGDLADGPHAFAVRAVDALANAGPDATRTFAIDHTRSAELILSSARDGGGDAEIYRMRLDGQAPYRLASLPGDDVHPSLSASGERLAFSNHAGESEIYTLDSDGSNLTRLTDNEWVDTQPALSPDGSRIAFVSDRDGNREIYLMRSDGSEVTRLTDAPGVDETPALSPDGEQLAFASARGTGDLDLYLLDLHGGTPTRITSDAGGDRLPAFSPDGRRLAFVSDRDGDAEIHSIGIDGTGPLQLTDNAVHDGRPSYVPDGDRLVFETDRDTDLELYQSAVDGSSPVRLTDVPGADGMPSAAPLLDTVAPAVSVTAPAEGSAVDHWTPQFDGTAGADRFDREVVLEVFAGTEPAGAPVATLSGAVAGDGAWALAPSGLLANGAYTARASQRDSAGNRGESPPVTFSVAVEPPQTSISSPPPPFVNHADVQIMYGADPGAAGFECRLDSAQANDWSSCDSPATLQGLGDAPHTFEVRAADAAGNTDPTPARAGFTVDTRAPTVRIDSSPPRFTPTDTASIGTSPDEPGVRVRCTVSAGATFKPCGSPYELTDLPDGSYVFRAFGIDRAANRSAIVRRSWTVDTVAPIARIDAGPSGTVAEASAEFAFAADEPGARFKCRLDRAPWRLCLPSTQFPHVAEGAHTLKLLALDRAMNTSGVIQRHWWSIPPTPHDSTPTANERPNVLVVISDDQPMGTMDQMPQTRAAFSGQGVAYENAVVTTPLCCPSRSTIYSGRYAHNHGVTLNSDGEDLDPAQTWQHKLQEAGYLTGIAGKYLNGISARLAPNFDDRMAWPASDPEDPRLAAASFVKFLEQAEADDAQPWAFVLAPSSPHVPFTVQPLSPRPLDPWQPAVSYNELDVSDKDPRIAEHWSTFNPRGVDRQRVEVQAIDEMVGRALDGLESEGEPDTLTFYLSDNGMLRGEHGLSNKQWPYLESVRVPFYAAWPGHLPAGELNTDLVANVDIAATIYEASGVAPGCTIDGHSLLGDVDRPWLFTEFPDPYKSPSWAALWRPGRHYIEWEGGFVEDYEADPSELEASNVPDPELDALLDEYRTCAGPSCP